MTEAEKLEAEIAEMTARLAALRKAESGVAVKDYVLRTLEGETTLSALFAGRDKQAPARRYVAQDRIGLSGSQTGDIQQDHDLRVIDLVDRQVLNFDNLGFHQG